VADSVLASQTAPPLTLLSEDEQLFRATVRQFAQENIAPLVRTMDEQQHFHPELIPQLFNLGLMGIEIPIEYGGSVGRCAHRCAEYPLYQRHLAMGHT